MVCRVGIDCGFFVEMSYMVNAMLYCLAHRVRFQLYSEDANFGTGTGWTEYFLPFCEEVHEPFHKKYNFHRPPSWHRILKLCWKERSAGPIGWKFKSILKTLAGRLVAMGVYREYVLFAQDVPATPEKHYDIPELGMKCRYHEAYALLARMIWRFQPAVLRQALLYKEGLALPALYDGVQIRGGDKATEAELVDGARIVEMLHPEDGSCVFVLTDDYRLMRELQAGWPRVRFVTLCQPVEQGYFHGAFCMRPAKERREALVRLLASVDLLLGCRKFVGSITTGPSVFVMMLRAEEPLVQAVDCPKGSLAPSLCLPRDARAAVSRMNLGGKT